MKDSRGTPKNASDKRMKSPQRPLKRSASAERAIEAESVAKRIASLKPIDGSPEPAKQRHARQKQLIKLVMSAPHSGKPPIFVSEKSDPPPYSARKSPSPAISPSSSGSPFSIPTTDTKSSPQSSCDKEDCPNDIPKDNDANTWSIQNPLKQLGSVKYCEKCDGKEAETLRDALEKLTWSITDKIINQVADKFLNMYKLQCEPLQNAIDRLGERVGFIEDCIVELGCRRPQEFPHPRITTRRDLRQEPYGDTDLDNAFCESDDVVLASSQMGLNVIAPGECKDGDYYDATANPYAEAPRFREQSNLPHRSFYEYAMGESRSA